MKEIAHTPFKESVLISFNLPSPHFVFFLPSPPPPPPPVSYYCILLLRFFTWKIFPKTQTQSHARSSSTYVPPITRYKPPHTKMTKRQIEETDIN